MDCSIHSYDYTPCYVDEYVCALMLRRYVKYRNREGGENVKRKLAKRRLKQNRKLVALYNTKEGGTNNGCFGGNCCPSKNKCC